MSEGLRVPFHLRLLPPADARVWRKSPIARGVLTALSGGGDVLLRVRVELDRALKLGGRPFLLGKGQAGSAIPYPAFARGRGRGENKPVVHPPGLNLSWILKSSSPSGLSNTNVS